MKIIGLDVGEKRIGVAKADSSTKIAIPVGFIEVDGLEFEKFAHIAKINHTNLFVLGLPRNNHGEETKQSVYVRNFAKSMVERIPNAKIRFQDETLTSVLAEDRLKRSKKKYQKGDIDAEAAAIILQDFVENMPIATRSKNAAKTTSDALDDKPMGHTLLTNTKTAVSNAKANASNLTKKEANKVKLKTKKVKHKMKTVTKFFSSIIILVIVILLAISGILIYKKIRADERQEEYARLESEMTAEVFSFTILPGETITSIQSRLIRLGYSDQEIETAFSKDYGFDFLRERPEGATLEGFLYGNTHEFYKSATVEEILRPFLDEMRQVIEENDLRNRYREHGLTLFEGITLASIVQKEAASQDQPTVAQVFLSRLAYNIPLGSDVTVSYAIDQVDPDRQVYTDNQSALLIDSCYNTRQNLGLPCGPISNPGKSALLAVAAPSETSYLYFLTGDDGMMYYSYTESEHIQNTLLHCQELCNISL